LSVYTKHRVKRGGWLLEDHGYLIASNCANFLFVNLQEITPLEENLTTHDNTRGIGDKPYNGEGAYTFSAGTFTDYTDTLTFVDIIGKVVYRPYFSFSGVEVGLEVINLQYFLSDSPSPLFYYRFTALFSNNPKFGLLSFCS